MLTTAVPCRMVVDVPETKGMLRYFPSFDDRGMMFPLPSRESTALRSTALS